MSTKLRLALVTVTWMGCTAVEAGVQPAGVVEKVERVGVIRDAPISVELSLDQGAPLTWENFVIRVSLQNLTTDPIVLRGFSDSSAFPYFWASIEDGEYVRAFRYNPSDLYVPPRGQSLTVLDAGAAVEFRLFIYEDELILPLRRDWFGQDSMLADGVDVSFVVCGVFVIVDGETATPIAVESNALNLRLKALGTREYEGLRTLFNFGRTPLKGHRPMYERYLDLLREYPDVPYAARLRYQVVSFMRYKLEELAKDGKELDPLVIESIEYCLAKGAPFADAVLNWSYFSYLQETKRWELLERAGKLLANVSNYDWRFCEIQRQIGIQGTLIDRDENMCDDAKWRRKLQPVFLECLRHSLERGDKHAERVAPLVLTDLERLREWELLARAAELVLQQTPDNPKAAEALDRARRALEAKQGKSASPGKTP